MLVAPGVYSLISLSILDHFFKTPFFIFNPKDPGMSVWKGISPIQSYDRMGCVDHQSYEFSGGVWILSLHKDPPGGLREPEHGWPKKGFFHYTGWLLGILTMVY